MGSSSDYSREVELIEGLTRYLYGQSHPDDKVSVGEIKSAMSQHEVRDIDRMLGKLDESEIVWYDRRNDVVELSSFGKEIHDLRCVPEVVLGSNFCIWRYSRAVVQIIVRNDQGDENSGTGFYVDDPADCVVTNRHVIENKKVIGINDSDGLRVCGDRAEVAFGPEDLDLAIVRCTTPANVLPLRIDWRRNAARPLDDVLVLGYPYIAFHVPTLYPASGQVAMYAPRISRNARESLLLTRIAAPGCSGSPVILRGLVVGVVEGEPIAKGPTGILDTMLCAVPADYLAELLLFMTRG